MLKYYLAVGISTSSVQYILGNVHDGRIVLEEIHRFDSKQVQQYDQGYWDMDNLWNSIVNHNKNMEGFS